MEYQSKHANVIARFSAMRIQITQATQTILAFLGGFHCELRGEVHVKGKGTLMTFWLLGANEMTNEPHQMPPLTDATLLPHK